MVKNNNLVSVIVPIYGTEPYLRQCIDSICNQSYENLQIVLVDDESPDNCPAICDEYANKDSRIKVIHQKNTGVSGARNTGIRNAEGEYLMFVDSDDELYPNGVETLLSDALKYNAHIVWAPFKRGGNKKTSTHQDVSIIDGYNSLLDSLNGKSNMNSACGKIFKVSFIQGILFEEGKNTNEDGFFMFQCYMKKPLLVCHNVDVYKYNIRDNSSSIQAFSEKYFSMLYFCDKKLQLVKEECPQYLDAAYNMVVRTNLLFLDVLCSTKDKKYKSAYKECAKTVRKYFKYHKPINKHHKMMARVIAMGLFVPYRWAVRLKYFR